jgi:NADP-dependent 3-hydroxy acid dehydrogenase YdfG
VAAEARQAGAAQAHVHALDVAQTTSVEAFLRWSRTKTDRLDVLLNNAGGAHGLDPVAEGKDEDWERMLAANVLGVLRVTRAALPLMLQNPGSTIINIGSVAGHAAYEGGAAYCAAKAGELQITRALRLELNGTGIRVTTVDPGLAQTEFSLVRFKGDAARAQRVYEGMHPLRAEDIADALVWVASRPPHVNISELIVMPVDQAAVYKVHRRKN